MLVSHAILIGCGSHEWCKPERHVVAKVERSIVLEQVFQRARGAEMKRIKQGVTTGQGSHTMGLSSDWDIDSERGLQMKIEAMICAKKVTSYPYR